MAVKGPFLVQSTIPYFTALPRDVITNTFHFLHDGAVDPTPTQLDQLRDLVAAFYEDIFPTGGPEMASYTRPLLHREKIYDLRDNPPRVPILDEVVPLTVATSAAYVPTEVAFCVSYQATPLSGQPQSRRRGRIYLGGLGANTGGVGGASLFPEPSSAFRANCLQAAENLRDNASVGEWRWVVYSPTEAALSGNKVAACSTVNNGWVDTAYDTQRRRGQAASQRQLWP